MKTSPLSDAELVRLEKIFKRFRGEGAMNLEELDGLFTALICCPSTVMPSEYLAEILGGEMADDEAFADQRELQDFLDLAMRHWNAISASLGSRDIHIPLLLKDDEGVTHGNDWARGFIRGMEMRRADWLELTDDEEHGGFLDPIFMLAHEHDPELQSRSFGEPLTKERRDELLAFVTVSIMGIYRYFERHRREAARSAGQSATFRRATAKVGRNDRCPCGSGKKYKQCCGDIARH